MGAPAKFPTLPPEVIALSTASALARTSSLLIARYAPISSSLTSISSRVALATSTALISPVLIPSTVALRVSSLSFIVQNLGDLKVSIFLYWENRRKNVPFSNNIFSKHISQLSASRHGCHSIGFHSSQFGNVI